MAEQEKATKNGNSFFWETKLENIRNIVEILAILLAGGWALYRFDLFEKPSLETKANAFSEMRWVTLPVNETECVVQFKATLENVGTTSFDIDTVQLKGWTFERKLDIAETATFIDDEAVQQNQPFFEKEFKNGKFIRRYPPTASYWWTYEWVVKNEPDQLLLIRIDFDGQDDKAKRFSTHTVSWSPICEELQ